MGSISLIVIGAKQGIALDSALIVDLQTGGRVYARPVRDG